MLATALLILFAGLVVGTLIGWATAPAIEDQLRRRGR